MKVAAIQFRPDKACWSGSTDRLAALVEQAARSGAQLVVCPELALTGYVFPDRDAARAVAETSQSRTLARFSPLCKEQGIYLVVGYPEADELNLFNSALVIGPGGDLIYNYRKRLLYEMDELWAQPGDRPYPLIHTPLGTVMVGICMDLNDDYFIAVLRHAQPDMVAFCANWIHQGMDIRPYWRARLRGVSAMLIAANTYGLEESPVETVRFLGRSAILGPLPGRRTLAFAEESGDQVLLAECQSKPASA